MAFFRSNWFVLGLIASIALAAIAPDLVTVDSPLSPKHITSVALFTIFLINGLILPTETIVSGLAKWRVHLFVHVFLFVATPILALALLLPVRGWLTPSLVSGFILLGALPCTISTSIVYSVRAGGSLAPAIFNATVANLVGVALTPLLVGLLAPSSGGQGIDVATAFLNTASTVIPPIIVGQILRQPIRHWATRHKARLNDINSLLILAIVYFAFAASVRDGIWERLGPGAFVLVASTCLILFVAQVLLAATTLRGIGFPHEDTVTAFVCSTQKTLAAGIPLANAIFADTSLDLGVILLPVLIFYAIQLTTGDAVIKRLVGPGPTPPRDRFERN